MKTIKLKYFDAIEYIQNNPYESITSVSNMFACDRHVLSNYLGDKLSELKFLFFTDIEAYGFTEREQQAITMYQDNDTTIQEITTLTGVSSATLSRWIKRFNIPKRGPRRLHHFNEHAFDNITTESQAYWLGFLLADGYINDKRNFVNIKLQVVDQNHLSKFLHFMSANDVEIKDDQGASGQTVKSVTLNSKYLVDTLAQYHLVNNKSGVEQPYLDLDPSLARHYIRGLIDGDGSLTHGTGYQIDLVGSNEIVQYFKRYINNNIISLHHNYIYDHGTIKRFTCRNAEVIYKCFDHFYSNAKIFLNRKYNIAMNYLHGRDKIEEKTGTV